MAGSSILIVDDNLVNLKLMRLLLQAEGHEVRTSADASEALAALRSFHPRVILMDIQLPGIDGLELTRQIKKDPATRDIAIIATTAYAMKGDEEKARAAGCDDYVTKPIDTEAFLRLLEQYRDPEPSTEMG